MRRLDGNTSLLSSESVDGVEGDESTLSEPGRIGINNNIISKINVQCIIYLEIVTDQHKNLISMCGNYTFSRVN